MGFIERSFDGLLTDHHVVPLVPRLDGLEVSTQRLMGNGWIHNTTGIEIDVELRFYRGSTGYVAEIHHIDIGDRLQYPGKEVFRGPAEWLGAIVLTDLAGASGPPFRFNVADHS